MYFIALGFSNLRNVHICKLTIKKIEANSCIQKKSTLKILKSPKIICETKT